MQGLYALKPWYARRLRGITDAAVRRGISPDVFTAIGVLGAAIAAVVIWRGWWWVALIALAVRLAGANLDGAVARARGVSRPWGFVLNEIGDRVSDLLMFAGLTALAARTYDGWSSAQVGYVLVAALAASLPTFASLAAAGAGAARRNGGPFGKTERCLVAVLATAFPGALTFWAGLIVVGSLGTAIARLTATHRELAVAG
ncbi:CDP-alcohol phosphatidyltransferase family protein [Branchiibius cervicis]|uniref:CDP-alcohol phosphatidyltransferase family protein n=1 Tax=Branchiibius cervicis TaxID=908252 RepID=A0ABW2AVZ4_9MICO